MKTIEEKSNHETIDDNSKANIGKNISQNIAENATIKLNHETKVNKDQNILQNTTKMEEIAVNSQELATLQGKDLAVSSTTI